VLECAAPDDPVPPTGQSGVHRTVRCTVRPTLCSRVFLATSAIIHWKVCARRRTVWCTSRATTTCHVDQGQRSYGAPDRPMPHRKENQPIRRFFAMSCARTVHCPVCTGQSGAPTDRRQELPTKWSSNDS
jgi:hypothetical protein